MASHSAVKPRRSHTGKRSEGDGHATEHISSMPAAQTMEELRTILAAAGEASVENETYWRTVRRQFPFDSDILYLNNGTIGICPHLVLQAQIDVLTHQETDPWSPMARAYPSAEDARNKVAALINASPSEVAFTRNSTESLNIIALGLTLDPADEILTTTHEHYGGWSCWLNRHDQFGNPVRKLDLHDPPEDEDQIVRMFEEAIRPETKVFSLCHVTCTTVWRLPVKKICQLARERGIISVIDGAQSLGMVKVDVQDMGCDFFASSPHKWLFTPKGTGLLYIRDEMQDRMRLGYYTYRGRGARLTARRFENSASQTQAPWIGFGVAVDFHNAIGTEAIEARGATMAEYLKTRLARIPGVAVLTPMSRRLSASMVSFGIGGMTSGDIGSALMQRYSIATRGLHEGGYHGTRVSCAIHNTYEELDRLLEAVAEITRNRV